MNYTLIIVSILLILFFVYEYSVESFDTVQEKKSANEKYFSNNKNPSYEDYRDAVPGGNFVDYTKYKKEFA